jgi:hypothetical protein
MRPATLVNLGPKKIGSKSFFSRKGAIRHLGCEAVLAPKKSDLVLALLEKKTRLAKLVNLDLSKFRNIKFVTPWRSIATPKLVKSAASPQTPLPGYSHP